MQTEHKIVIGWDIGGAHVKAVMLHVYPNGTQQVAHVLQLPCPLWRGLDQLSVAIAEVEKAWQLSNFYSDGSIDHAITMTGELVDLFENRQQGVLAISECLETQLVGKKHFFVMQPNTHLTEGYAFVPFEQVASAWQSIASANWFASAQWIAKHVGNALLIDIGSTTADFVLMQNHTVLSLKDKTDGLTDAARMQQQTLIYTGVVRTPLMAFTQEIPFLGKPTTIAAEYFATAADVYRMTQDLDPSDDMAETADGKDKSVLATAKRLARMVGHDVTDATMTDWQALAHAFKAVQLQRLYQVAKQHLHATAWQGPVSIVGAGVGRFLAAEVATLCHVSYISAAEAINHGMPNQNAFTHTASKVSISDFSTTDVCFPAYAVAALLLQTVESFECIE